MSTSSNKSNLLKIGSIITCNRPGWWRVVAFDKIDKAKVLLELALDPKGCIPKNSKKIVMFEKWCHAVTVEDIKSQKAAEIRKFNNLIFIINPNLIDLESVDQSIKNEINLKIEPEFLSRLTVPASLIKS